MTYIEKAKAYIIRLKSLMIQPDWYKIKGVWYHCVSDGEKRYVNGKLQTDCEV